MYEYLGKKLYVAVVEGDLEQLKDLMNNRGNINHVFYDHGDTLLHYAPTAEVASFLLLHMAKANVKDKYGQTPLCSAVARPNGLEVVQVLLAAGADVNVKMRNGKTPLHYAPNLEITRLLLQHGAQVNAKDKYGCTPLHSALIDRKGLEVFKCLLDAGADITARFGDNKNTVLHFADSLDIVREILSRGFDINATTSKNQTPLHSAVRHMKELPVIRELLKCGAKVNSKDKEGDTAVMFAVRNYVKDYKVVQLLMEYGAVIDELFYDYQLTRRANCLGYLVSRDMELAKLISRIRLLQVNANVDAMPCIGTDACPKVDRDYILDYIDRCALEVPLLKKHKLFGSFSLYDLLVSRKIFMKPLYFSYKNLEIELPAKYPFYHEMILSKIRPYLERGRLLNRLRWLELSLTKVNYDMVTLNPDCTRVIIQMLPDDSLWNLIIASELKGF